MRAGRRVRGNGGLAAGPVNGADLPDRAWKLFDVVNGRIEHADVKAGAILGACGVGAAALVGLISSRGGRDIPLLAAGAVSGVFVLISAVSCCAVLRPRRLRGKLPDSLIYFDHLARRPSPPGTYQDLRGLLADPEALGGEIIKQILATSRVASRKYDLLDRAMMWFFAALVALSGTAFIFVLNSSGH
jgi:Family of unknown function (DUF5706)